MRGVAVLMVMAHHVGLGQGGGALAVAAASFCLIERPMLRLNDSGTREAHVQPALLR